MPAVIIGDIDTGLNYATNSQVWINQGEIPKGLPIKDVDGDLVITFKDLNAPYYYNAPYVRDSNGNGVIDGQDLLADTRWANGVDDDQNGYLDDLVGWNFVYGTNNATDINGHGTWIASIISQSAGPSTYIVPIQIIGNFPSGAWSQAVDYFTALAEGARRRRALRRNEQSLLWQCPGLVGRDDGAFQCRGGGYSLPGWGGKRSDS